MNIKNNKPSKKSQYIQGYINILECKKYTGQGPIIYRSSRERRFSLYCERNPNIEKWSSEPVTIKYYNPLDEKYHNYFPDFLIKLVSGSIILIEIKPKSQLVKPNPPKKKTKKAITSYQYAYKIWVSVMCKKSAAEEYCKSRNRTYEIITEDFFNKIKD